MLTLPNPVPYFALVWDIVRQTARGEVTTFKQIAEMIPTPDGVEADDYAKLGARWVGDAMNAVSFVDEKSVPWHRVINSKGTISLPERSPAAALQRARLREEGIEFDAKDRIDFIRFGWAGPPSAWIESMGLLPPRSLRPIAAQSDDDAPQQLNLF